MLEMNYAAAGVMQYRHSFNFTVALSSVLSRLDNFAVFPDQIMHIKSCACCKLTFITIFVAMSSLFTVVAEPSQRLGHINPDNWRIGQFYQESFRNVLKLLLHILGMLA